MGWKHVKWKLQLWKRVKWKLQVGKRVKWKLQIWMRVKWKLCMWEPIRWELRICKLLNWDFGIWKLRTWKLDKWYSQMWKLESWKLQMWKCVRWKLQVWKLDKWKLRMKWQMWKLDKWKLRMRKSFNCLRTVLTFSLLGFTLVRQELAHKAHTCFCHPYRITHDPLLCTIISLTPPAIVWGYIAFSAGLAMCRDSFYCDTIWTNKDMESGESTSCRSPYLVSIVSVFAGLTMVCLATAPLSGQHVFIVISCSTFFISLFCEVTRCPAM